MFGFILVPTWLHAPPNRSKSFQKSIPKHIKILIDFQTDLKPMWASFGGPTRNHVGDFFDQKSVQNPSQTRPRPTGPPQNQTDTDFYDFGSFFDRFLLPTWTPDPTESLLFRKSKFPPKNHLSQLMPILIPFFVPTWLYFPSQNRPKSW